MADQQWFSFDTLRIADDPFSPLRSYHSSEESDAGSHGGSGFRPHGQMSGGEFIGGHGRQQTPSFSYPNQLVHDDRPYLPPREAPQQPQYVAPAQIHSGMDAQVCLPARGRVRN
jgi:hypothetical protein